MRSENPNRFSLRHAVRWTMSGLFASDQAALGAAVYCELVRCLFLTRWPPVVIGLGYFGLSLVAYCKTGDPQIGFLCIFGSAVALVRTSLVPRFRRLPAELAGREDVAELWEHRYAIGSYSFAICLGLLEVKLLLGGPHETSILGVTLLYGYGAGLVARVCMRPRICIASLLLAGLPAIGAMLARPGYENISIGIFSSVFVIAAIETILLIYRTMVAQAKMRHEFSILARHDDLTGLPNRLQMREQLSRELDRVARYGGLVAIHYLDLDRFKTTNDRFGHPIGDELLMQVGERLKRLIRSTDVVGRLGGDEFLVVQSGVVHPGEAQVLAMRIIRAISEPFDIHGQTVTIGTSVGIALAPTDSMDMTTLIKYADIALYRAKGRGHSCHVFYEDEPALTRSLSHA